LRHAARCDATYERIRFVPSTGFRGYGEPARTEVIVNGRFAAVVGVLVLTFVSRAAIPNRR
jgi:hypothetical protein